MGPRETPRELRQPSDFECCRYRYEANVVDGITLPADISGLVGVRVWHLRPGMYIVSPYGRRRYSSSVIWADRIPTAANNNGIYACQPPVVHYSTVVDTCEEVIGIVELRGHVAVHQDGVLRGECCRILMFIAHSDFAGRLSRIYGIPVVAANCGYTAAQKINSWLRSREGITLLKWNLDLISDMQAKRLLSQVDGLNGEVEEAAPDEEVPEDLKDKGEPVRGGDETVCRRTCTDCVTLIVRNAALEEKLVGGWRAFGKRYGFVSDAEISVLQVASPGSLNGPLTEILASGLSSEEHYVLVEPMCLRCRSFNPKAKHRPRKSRLRADWLSNEIDWLNANIEGRYYWRESVKPARPVSKPQARRKHAITEWINSILHAH